MNLSIYLAAALGVLLSLAGTAVGAYKYGISVQTDRDKAAQIPEYQRIIDQLDKARVSAADAYSAQVANAEQYAKDLGEARADVRVITTEIPRYVASNPAPSSCDISEWLFIAFNKATAETRKP